MTTAALSAILFDLDGTLIDTAREIAQALNRSLAERGLRCAPFDRIRGWIGDGARALLRKALADQGLPADAALWERFAFHYEAACGTQSAPFPGVRDLLEGLRARGLHTGVLTNKEGRFARRLLEHHGLAGAFDLIIAGDTLPVKKPDPAVIRHALRVWSVDAGSAVLMGDSPTDVRAARAAGVRVWIVRYGYAAEGLSGADAPDALVDSLEGLDVAAMWAAG